MCHLNSFCNCYIFFSVYIYCSIICHFSPPSLKCLATSISASIFSICAKLLLKVVQRFCGLSSNCLAIFLSLLFLAVCIFIISSFIFRTYFLIFQLPYDIVLLPSSKLFPCHYS